MNTIGISSITKGVEALQSNHFATGRTVETLAEQARGYVEAEQLGTALLDLIVGLPLRVGLTVFSPHGVLSGSDPQGPFKAGTVRRHDNGRVLEAELAAKHTIHGITFPKGSIVYFDEKGIATAVDPVVSMWVNDVWHWGGNNVTFEKGRVSQLVIGHDGYVQGVPCHWGRIYVHPNGKLRDAQLYKRHRFGSVRVPAKSYVELDTQGRLVEISTPIDLTFHGISYSRGEPIKFHPSGVVKHALLAGNQTIQGVPCRGGSSVRFDERGKLVGANLSVDKVVIKGVPCMAYTTPWKKSTDYDITFHPDGTIKHAQLAKTHAFDGIACKGGKAEDVHFWPNGRLRKGTLAFDTVLGTTKGLAGEEFSLYEDGKLGSLHLKKSRSINNLPCGRFTDVKFFPSGKIYEFTPSRDITLMDIPCAEGYATRFHHNGKLRVACLALPQTIGNHILPKETFVWFDTNGELEYFQLTESALIKGQAYPKGTVWDVKRNRLVRIVRQP